MQRQNETLILLGGSRSGERVTVRSGVPFVRMPRRLPLPRQIVRDIGLTAPDDSELYKRLRVGKPGQETAEYFVLDGMSDAEIAKALSVL